MDILHRIKHLIVRGRYRFTYKAMSELYINSLEPEDALESILNASTIKKSIRSRSPQRIEYREKIYVIENFSYRGTLIYTKRRIAREAGEEVYYLLISSKRSTPSD